MQLNLPMLTVYEGPRLVDSVIVGALPTYRSAVRKCWELRTRPGMTIRLLAYEAELYASHASDYISAHEGKRELPARHVNAFEIACGNRAISQWLAAQARLTILEQFIEQRRLA